MKYRIQLLLVYLFLPLLLIFGVAIVDNLAQKKECEKYSKDHGKSTTFYEYRGCFVTLHNGNLMRLDDYKKTNNTWR